MKRALTILAALVAAVPGAASAAADEPKGASQAELGQIAETIGQCLAADRKLHDKAVKFVLSGQLDDGKKLARVECFGSALDSVATSNDHESRYSVRAMRSAVANSLVNMDFQQAGPMDFTGVSPLEPAVPDQNSSEDEQFAERLVDQVGECAARIAPEEVRAMALTKMASKDEVASLRALVPTMGQCLPAGASLPFPIPVLRNALVTAYARLAYSPGAGKAAQGAAD